MEDWSAFSEYDQKNRLEMRWLEVNGSKPAMLLALIDSLELRMMPHDDEFDYSTIQFRWQMAGFSNSFIEIQLFVENSERIGESGQPDILSVTFWDTKYFKNRQGDEVRYGTELRTDIFRQINPDEAAQIDSLLDIYWPPFLLIFCFCIIGAQLPTWMFVNSLSLIVHTTLLNSIMPPSVFYTFKKYLHLVRLNWPDLNEDIQASYDVFEYSNDDGLYSAYLRASDYVHLFARNTVIIICSVILIAAVWLLAALIDRLLAKKHPLKNYRFYKCGKSKNEPYVNNFLLRFFYELFLELCICSLINVALVDWSASSPSLQWALSCLVLAAIFVYFCWLISLCFCRGPYLSGFYHRGTAISSFWGPRRVNKSYKASEQLDQI